MNILDQVKNGVEVTVSTGYDASATSIALASGEGAKLPDPASGNYNLVWWDSTSYKRPFDDPNVEIIRVTGKSTDTLTATRGQESIAASTKNTSAHTYKMMLAITAKMIADIDTAIFGKLTKTISATSRVLGRISAGSGDAEELTGANIRSIANVADGATANAKASVTEIDAGADAEKFLTPDDFAGSNRSKRIVYLKIFDDATALATGDGKHIFMVPVELNGMNLVDVEAFVTTVSSSGTPIVQIRNVTDSVDMLSTRITIDANENSSITAAAAPVIDTTKDDVATGDLLAIDVDGAGTGAKGLGVLLSFQTP